MAHGYLVEGTGAHVATHVLHYTYMCNKYTYMYNNIPGLNNSFVSF